MENKKSIIFYYILATVMVMTPVLSSFGFIPLIMIYKKSNFKRYIMSSVILTTFMFLALGSFTSIIPFAVSFIFIKYMDKSKKGYETILLASFVMATLLTLDLMAIKLNTEIYGKFLDSAKELYDNFSNVYGIQIDDFEKIMNQVVNFYPSISFISSYISITIGYCVVNKYIYKNENDIENMVSPTAFKFVGIFLVYGIVLAILQNYIGDNLYTKLELIFSNVFFGMYIILSVQGFVCFNTNIKKKVGNKFANIISVISLFIFFSYFLYFIYGIYYSIKRGVFNGKKIN